MKKTNAIVFAQAQDNAKVVVATRNGEAVYVAHALMSANKPIWEALGATRLEGEKGLYLAFKTAKNAKAFITQAICELNAKDYTKARKTEPKAKVEPKKAVAPAPTKGKKADDLVTVTLSDGTKVQVKKSDLIGEVKAPRKTKGNTKPTVAPNAKAKAKTEKVAPKKAKGNTLEPNAQKMLERMKMSILNRAASAYSIANGGAATNFDALGKTEKELAKYIPNAKAGLLKSSKWANAKKMGITEDMLG